MKRTDQCAYCHLLHVGNMIIVKQLDPVGLVQLLALGVATTAHAQAMLIPVAEEWAKPQVTKSHKLNFSAQSPGLLANGTNSLNGSGTTTTSSSQSSKVATGFQPSELSSFLPEAPMPPLIIPVAGYHQYQETPKELSRRQHDPTSTKAFLGTLSPDKSPVSITQLGQLVTSYIPVLTICPFVEPNSLLAVSRMDSSLRRSLNRTIVDAESASSASTDSKGGQVAFLKRPRYIPTYPLNTSCSISYGTMTTRIWNTTLSPLAAPAILVTDCDQSVTFSSEFGFKFFTPSGMIEPSFAKQQTNFQTLTTYYVAAWSDINPGTVPTGPLEVVICSRDGCDTEWQTWETGAGGPQRTQVSTLGSLVATVAGVCQVPNPRKSVARTNTDKCSTSASQRRGR